MEPDADVIAYYDRDEEHARLLDDPIGRLELARTKRLLRRVLPPAPARVLDIGGGSGVYASWLVELGYEVEVIDLVPLHVQRCVAGGIPAEVGDARHLQRHDGSYDAVLLLGPLYHLPERDDRLLALREAHRVLVPGGVVAAAAISRYAPMIDGLARQWEALLARRDVVVVTLGDGRHTNPERAEGWFTTAYFHLPDELSAEVADAGFDAVDVRSVESMGWVLPQLADVDLDLLCELLDLLDAAPSLLGASSHLLATGRKDD